MDQSELAHKLNYIFIELKRINGGFCSIPPGKLGECFEKAAAVCITLDADPEEYIKAQFYQEEPERILPQFLYSKMAIARYENYKARPKVCTVSLDEIYELNCKYLKKQLELGYSVDEILMCDSILFTPWFRICISKEAIPAVTAKYKTRAREEFDDSLKEFLKKKSLEYKRITL